MSFAPADAPQRGEAAGLFRKGARAGLVLALIASILPYGSPEALPFFVAAALTGLAAVMAALAPARRPANRAVAAEILVLVAVLAAYALFQAASFAGNPFAHDIWLRAASFLGAATRAVSVEPSATQAALFGLLAPLFACYAVVQLFDDDRSALNLLKVLAVLGGLFGLHGLLQLLFFPEGLLLPTRPGANSLTGVFINRNTAGTFLGIGSLASLGWLLGALAGERGPPSGRARLADAFGRNRQAIAATACLALCVLCLFLTRSRGAMLSWLAAFGLVVVLVALNVKVVWPRLARGHAARFRPLMLAAAGVVAVVVAVELLGGQTAARLGHQGVDVARLCVYEATMRAFADNWLFGTGLGTFAAVFPGYQTAGCAPIDAMFFRAHNFYLEALLGLGVIAVPLFAYVYWRLGTILVRGYRQRARLRPIPVVGIGGAVLVTLHGLTDFSLQIPGMAMYFACFLGAVISVALRDGRRGAA